ncbi:hypothetical protein EPN87_03095 [archaeon]|nr:MAG: hypothetical protein EPN87_03095 [archaeon]
MKGQIALLESISMILVLFVSFAVFFAPQSYDNNWQVGNLLVNARDVILTLDRSGMLYDYSTNPGLMDSFLIKVLAQKNMQFFYGTDNAIKGTITVACNCTPDQINNITSWSQGLLVNNRSVQVIACPTALDNINECLGTQSDALVIWGYKDMTPYQQVINTFMSSGSGVVEIMDLPSSLDVVQQKIFGIDSCSKLVPSCGWGNDKNDDFFAPSYINSSSYIPYKYFYNIPVNLRTTTIEASVPTDGPTCASQDVAAGNLTFQGAWNKFWICTPTSVFFDTNNNGKADVNVGIQRLFKIGKYNFTLTYVNNNNIGVSYRPMFNFTDFVKAGGSQVYPIDSDVNRVLLYRGNYSNGKYPVPVAITNGTFAKTVWVADFTRNGNGDDYRQLFLSLLMSVANKKSTTLSESQIRLGYYTSYVNVVKKDIFEVYSFNLGLGYPK